MSLNQKLPKSQNLISSTYWKYKYFDREISMTLFSLASLTFNYICFPNNNLFNSIHFSQKGNNSYNFFFRILNWIRQLLTKRFDHNIQRLNANINIIFRLNQREWKTNIVCWKVFICLYTYILYYSNFPVICEIKMISSAKLNSSLSLSPFRLYWYFRNFVRFDFIYFKSNLFPILIYSCNNI